MRVPIPTPSLSGGDPAAEKAARLPTDRRLLAFRDGGPDPSLDVLYFNFGRHLLIGSSRPGGLEVDAEWQHRMLTAAVVRSLSGIPFRVQYRAVTREVRIPKGQTFRWDGRP